MLTASAASVSGRGAELTVRPIVEPSVTSVVCLATPANRPATPLARHAAALLTELVRALPQHRAACRPPAMPIGDSS